MIVVYVHVRTSVSNDVTTPSIPGKNAFNEDWFQLNLTFDGRAHRASRRSLNIALDFYYGEVFDYD